MAAFGDMKKIIPLFIIVSALLASAGCATAPRGFPARDGIANFDRVNENLYRGAQPNSFGIEALARLGVKTIINLRMAHDVWPAEDAEAKARGITYTNVPLSGLGRPTNEQVAIVLSILENARAPVFVHCKFGCDRTGTIIACYRIKHDRWTSEQALAEAKEYGMSSAEVGMKNFVEGFAKAHKCQ